MSTATGQASRRDTKPAPYEAQADLYDPHFPARRRMKDARDHVRTETFDPHFPLRQKQ